MTISRILRIRKNWLILLFVLFTLVVHANANTSIYIFEPNQSNIVQTGGIAGVHNTYSVTGSFCLEIDPNAGIAAFIYAFGNAVDINSPESELDPNEVFKMTSLAGTVIDSNTIYFSGMATDDSEILITVNMHNNYAQLTGQTTPPPGSADFYIYQIDAVAKRKYSGGTGEENNPFKIATAEDLITLGETPDDYDFYNYNDFHFILTANIDLDPNLPGRRVFDKAIIAPEDDSGRGSGNGIPFSGIFDGNGHTISNITIEGGSYLGLFGCLDSSAEIMDLGLVDVNIVGYGSAGCVGSLAGSNGYIYSMGSEDGGIISRCYSTGYVWGISSSVGGLVGQNIGYSGTVSQCYSSTFVHGYQYIGGLVGSNYGSIELCYSSGTVEGNQYVGGLVGQNMDGENGRSFINLGFGTVSQCYSNGYVEGNRYIGGFTGTNSGFIDTCFWDIETSGVQNGSAGPDSNGVTGKTTSEMQDPNTFRAAGWDFYGLSDGPHDLWAGPEGGGYPILWWQLSPFTKLPEFSGGSGIPDEPYLISTPEQLNSIGHNPRLMKYNFKLINDIDLAGFHFYPIGNYPFLYEGNFDGNYHEILNMTIEGHRYLGLIGCLDKGSIRNVGVVDVNIIGTGSYVGGLVGSMSSGNISQCYSTGSITSTSSFVGGLVGWNLFSYDINQCYSTASVTGYSWVGGLIGENLGFNIVSECYSTGFVIGNRGGSGGLVGTSSNQNGPSVNESFWDVETSGQLISALGTGKTTAEMQMESTFTDAGWDFIGETTNGTEGIWWIDEGQDYPRLWWDCNMVQNTVIEIEPADFNDVIAEGVVLVDFYATWCSHCTTQAPIIEEVADQIECLAHVAKFDADKSSSIVHKYSVTAIPTLIVFKNGIETTRFVGVTQADELIAAIMSALE
ncbi:MAG: hypothetical protein JXA96_05595 [Sedimentisphaerales bacterium]|nr:hypothetical protein [Sedimentisphaerales bacterium]